MSAENKPVTGGEPIVEKPVTQGELDAVTARVVSDDVLIDPNPLTLSDDETTRVERLHPDDFARVKAQMEAASIPAPPAPPVVPPTAEREVIVIEEPVSAQPAATTVLPAQTPAIDPNQGAYVSAAPAPAAAATPLSAQGDGLPNNYFNAPIMPDARGNRGAGVLISFLATVAYAIVYAAVLFVGFLFHHPVEEILDTVLLNHLLSPGFIAAVVGFFVSMVFLVLVVGRAGWWAYVLGGFTNALFVWVAATAGYGYSANLTGIVFNMDSILAVGGIPQVLAAAIVAREVTVWFGAWIGARGRKMKRYNEEAVAEYEQALAELEQRTI